MNKRLLPLIAALLLGACTAAEPHQDSGIPAPHLWTRLIGRQEAPVAFKPDAAVEQQWWASFNDPALNTLIEQGLAGNKTLQIAKARLLEARGDREATQSLLYPQVNGTANATRENLGFLYNKPVGIAQGNLQATWEFDLFGENQARVAATRAIVEAVQADEQAATITLLSDIARAYFDYRDADRQVAITEQNLSDQHKTLDVTNAQFAGGELSNLDVQRTTAQVATTEAELPTLHARRDADLNALSVLTGTTPGAVDKQLAGLPALAAISPQIIVSAPARVMAARPDVRAAERQFASTISLKKAAQREIFPTISLSAMFGLQDATTVFTKPWTLAAGLSQPIINFGAISSQIDIAKAEQQQAFLTYQQTVLTALQDMENALSAYGHETERNAALQQSVNAAVKAEELARQQFTGGEINLLDLLIAERDTLSAQSALATSDMLLRQDLVHIYTAAGGGWDVAGTPPSK